MTDDGSHWYALKRQKLATQNKVNKSIFSKSQKASTYRNFEFNAGARAKQIKFISD